MNFLSRYIRYLKDNPEQYWFKRRAYGWGWVPATWQGWLTLLVFLGIFLWLFVPFVNGLEPTGTETFWFLTKMLIWAAPLLEFRISWASRLSGNGVSQKILINGSNGFDSQFISATTS